MELRLNVLIEYAALYRVEVARFSHELADRDSSGAHGGAPLANNFLFYTSFLALSGSVLLAREQLFKTSNGLFWVRYTKTQQIVVFSLTDIIAFKA